MRYTGKRERISPVIASTFLHKTPQQNPYDLNYKHEENGKIVLSNDNYSRVIYIEADKTIALKFALDSDNWGVLNYNKDKRVIEQREYIKGELKETTTRAQKSPFVIRTIRVKDKSERKVTEKYYYNNGQLARSYTRVGSKKIGSYKLFYKDGSKRKTTYFKLSKGRKGVPRADGIVTLYREKGLLQHRTSVKNGKKTTGWSSVYSEAGSLTNAVLVRGNNKKPIQAFFIPNALCHKDKERIRVLLKAYPDMLDVDVAEMMRKFGIDSKLVIEECEKLRK